MINILVDTNTNNLDADYNTLADAFDALAQDTGEGGAGSLNSSGAFTDDITITCRASSSTPINDTAAFDIAISTGTYTLTINNEPEYKLVLTNGHRIYCLGSYYRPRVNITWNNFIFEHVTDIGITEGNTPDDDQPGLATHLMRAGVWIFNNPKIIAPISQSTYRDRLVLLNFRSDFAGKVVMVNPCIVAKSTKASNHNSALYITDVGGDGFFFYNPLLKGYTSIYYFTSSFSATFKNAILDSIAYDFVRASSGIPAGSDYNSISQDSAGFSYNYPDWESDYPDGAGTGYAINQFVKDTNGVGWLSLVADNTAVLQEGANWTQLHANDLTNQTFTYQDADNGNYRPKSNTQGVIEFGYDLSEDADHAFNTDADGISRPQGAAWDRGPYEYQSTLSRSPFESRAFTSQAIRSGAFR